MVLWGFLIDLHLKNHMFFSKKWLLRTVAKDRIMKAERDEASVKENGRELSKWRKNYQRFAKAAAGAVNPGDII